MGFDRTNSADLAALKTEVEANPAGMAYVTPGPTAPLVAILNDPESNVTNATVQRPTEELDIPEIAGVIDSTEYAALDSYGQRWVQMFIGRAADVVLRPYQSKFLELFGDGSATRTAAIALRTKDASRAEELFGVNTVISREDWIAARDS